MRFGWLGWEGAWGYRGHRLGTPFMGHFIHGQRYLTRGCLQVLMDLYEVAMSKSPTLPSLHYHKT